MGGALLEQMSLLCAFFCGVSDMRRIAILLGGLTLLLTAEPAWALITALTPLTGPISENQFICIAVVSGADAGHLEPGAVAEGERGEVLIVLVNEEDQR